MERKWISRPYQPGDEKEIGALWLLTFPENDEVGRAEVEYWNWQYKNSPAGFGRIRVAVADEGIVGHYAVVPVRMQFEGKSLGGTLSLDTMTHPQYQRQGILATLANDVYDELGRDNFPITYGFPNENSLGPLTKKLGWKYVCALPVYVKPLRPDVITERVLTNGALATIGKPLARLGTALVCRGSAAPREACEKVHWLQSFDQRADHLWDEACDPSKLTLTRNTEFLNWRYVQNPLRDYRILGYEEQDQLVAYAVVRCMEQIGLQGGMIMELVARPGRDDALEAVLAVAEEYFRNQGMDLVACLMHGDKRSSRLLKHQGFLQAPKKMFKEWHFGVRTNADGVDEDSIADPSRWYITLGDTDII